MNSTHPTESTAPASSATSTTPTGDGGTTATEKRRAPTAAHFRRERRRRQKALHQLKMLEAANNRLWEEKEAMQREVDRLGAFAQGLQGDVERLNKKLRAVSAFREESDRFACQLHVRIAFAPNRLERVARTTAINVLWDIAKHLRIDAADTVLKAMAESPVTLLDASPDAARVLRKAKDTWIHEYMQRHPYASFLPDRALERLWDAALDAIRAAAAAIPADIKITWVDMHKPPDAKS